jgi:CubicO group peptidase (beta-lactamase class C family)
MASSMHCAKPESHKAAFPFGHRPIDWRAMKTLTHRRGAAIVLVAALGGRSRAVSAQAAGDPRFDAIASLAEAKMKEFGVPGLALGILNNGVVTTRGLGITNVEDPLPVTPHTVFPIASISKTFAATAIMRLVEQGKIDLRAPVRTYLPDFRVRDENVSRDVTVWHLLTHLGGWEGQVSGPDRGTETLKNFVASTTVTDLMQVAPPGAAWSYNNAGFSIAGRVIEAVTGNPINRAIRDLVFQPLGLEHAGTTAGEFIVQRFASGHTSRNGAITLQRPFVPSSSVTAGGVGLCITDLLAYARFHLGDGASASGERILKRETLELMRTPQSIKQSTDDSIGIAWHLRRMGTIRTAAHGGTLGGHILLLELVPERNFAIAILTNANVGWRVIQDVERAALKSYVGATYAVNQGIAHRGLVETLPSVQPLAKQPDPAPYVGTYLRPMNSVVVRADGNKIFVQERPNNGQPNAEMPIAFFGPDRAVVTDGPQRDQAIEFVRDASGRVNWVRVVGRVAVRTQ